MSDNLFMYRGRSWPGPQGPTCPVSRETVQLCTVFVLILGKTIAIDIPELDAGVTELRRQKLMVRLHGAKTDT